MECHKFSYKNGEKERSFYIRRYKMADNEVASQNVASRGITNEMAFQVALQNELVKLLLVAIDDKQLSGADKEQLDDLLFPGEYPILLDAIKQVITGGKDTLPKLQTEQVSFTGNK